MSWEETKVFSLPHISKCCSPLPWRFCPLWQGWTFASKTTERHESPTEVLQSFWMNKKSCGIPLESSRILWDPPSLLLQSAWIINSIVKICMVGQYSSLASNFPRSWLANPGWYGPSSKQLSLVLDYFSFKVPDCGGPLLLVCWLCKKKKKLKNEKKR